MLTEQEELALKELARQHTPTPVVNPNRTTPGFDNESARAAAQHVDGLFARLGNGGQRVVAGPMDGEASVPQVRIAEDEEFLSRVDHVLLRFDDGPQQVSFVGTIRKLFRTKRRETAGEFISRTGLGPAQAKQMTKDQITAFVAQAMRNNEDDPGAIPPHDATFKPRPPIPGWLSGAPRFVEVGAPEPDEPAEQMPAWT
jgi:hypothetical protein